MRHATTTPTVTVVLPVFDSATTIDAQLGALATQTYDGSWEIVVADNGCTDATVQRVERWRPHLPPVRVVDASQRRGVSHARNVGIRESRAPVWVCCDADDVVSAGWLAAMVAALHEHEFVVGHLDKRSLNSHSGVRGTTESSRCIETRFLPYAIGCNVGATRGVFERVGGFDEQFLCGGEDVDFSWRAQLAGVELHYAPTAVVSYRHRTTTRAALRQIHGYARSEVALYRKFRSAGLSRPALRSTARQYAWLLARLPLVVNPGPGRRHWLRVAAKRLGYLRGSWENRVLHP